MWVSDSYESIYARAETSLARGDYERARDNFRRLSERLAKLKPIVLQRRPELHNLHLLSLTRLAEIHHLQGQFEEALQLYEQLTEISPETRDRWRRSMALLQIDMGRVEEGLDELRAQAVAYPHDHELWMAIGLEAEALDRLDEAEENLQRAARRASEPDDKTDAYLALFDFYRDQGRVEEALNAWEQAWEAHGHEPGYVFPLYQMMWETGDLEQAYEYLSQERNPLRKGFYRGLLAASEGKPDEAAKQWKRVAEMDPMDFEEGQEAWAEAVLRVDHPPQKVIEVLSTIVEEGDFTQRGLVLQAIAEARIEHVEHAENVLEFACNLMMQSRPRRERLSAAHWELFDELVSDDKIKGQLRHYFEEDSESEAEAAE